MASEQKIDYEIMQSLSSLMEFEMQDSLKENDFKTYKSKSKEVLAKLLVKLESNAEYQKYLEGEVKRLEDTERKYISDTTSKEEMAAQNAFQMKEKDITIQKLEKELEASQLAFSKLQDMRAKEMQTVAVVCSALTKRIRALNINFESGGDGDDDGDDNSCDSPVSSPRE